MRAQSNELIKMQLFGRKILKRFCLSARGNYQTVFKRLQSRRAIIRRTGMSSLVQPYLNDGRSVCFAEQRLREGDRGIVVISKTEVVRSICHSSDITRMHTEPKESWTEFLRSHQRISGHDEKWRLQNLGWNSNSNIYWVCYLFIWVSMYWYGN